MQRILQLKSYVQIQHSDEHGDRLIFLKNALNPRNELGKYGISFSEDNAPGCFAVEATLLKYIKGKPHKKDGEKLYINRNSLWKYLNALEPTFTATPHTDEELITKLNALTWTDKLNSKYTSTATAQGQQGERMRHVGQHNQSKLSGWLRKLSDSIVGSFFSWLYRATVVSVPAFISRFLFIRKEKSYFKVSETLAKKRFTEAKESVPAYKKHVEAFAININDKTRFADIPVTTKENYIKPNIKDVWDTCVDGKLPEDYKIDTSTGTTGNPTIWYRSSKEIEPVKQGLVTMGRLSLGNRKVFTINAFALGPWATGLSVHELARMSGSVFSPGQDPEKIFIAIDNQYRNEQAQLDKALLIFEKQLRTAERTRPNIGVELKKLANEILDDLVKDHDLTVTKAIKQKVNDKSNPHLKKYLSALTAMITPLNAERKQIMLTGYPPFLLELAKYAVEKKIDIKKYCITAMVGGQALSEAMRQEVENRGFHRVMSSFGASDLDINIGMESDFEVSLRRALENNPGMARELYGENQGAPMVFRYDPLNYHIECDPKDNHLIMTCNRDNRASPRVRYDIQDQGRVYAASDVQAMLSKYGLFSPSLKMKHNLPFLFIWGRDSTAGYGKVNVPFDQLEKGLLAVDSDKIIYKRALHSYEVAHKATFDIWLELNDKVEFPNNDEMRAFQAKLIQEMASNNEYFADEISKLSSGDLLPKIVFFKRKESPIAEIGGALKQVLIFKKDVNFKEADVSKNIREAKLTKAEYDDLLKPKAALAI